MNVMWSGPGRALQFHLMLYEHVSRVRGWVNANVGHDVEYEKAPRLYKQRLNLMSSTAETGPATDGTTTAVRRDDPNRVRSPHNVSRATALILAEHHVLNEGETHYMSHHVSSALTAAAESADDEPLFPTDLPCPTGLLVFEYPLMLPDLHPDTGEVIDVRLPVRAIGWDQRTVGLGEGGSTEGIFYTLYTDRDTYRSIFIPSLQAALPDQPLGPYSPAEEEPSWVVDTSAWAFGRSWQRANSTAPHEDIARGVIHDTVAITRRFLLAYFRWSWQRIIVGERYHPSRPEQKRAMRVGKPLEDGYIKTLRLRREVEAEQRGRPETDGFYFDHQWIVRGHWRRQWYRSLGPARNDDGTFNHGSHRMVWIEPHASGNPFGTLVIGHNVTAAVR